LTDEDILYPVIEIRIVPGKYSDPSLLEFNWTYVNYTTGELRLQLTFSNPLAVSSLQVKDFLEI